MTTATTIQATIGEVHECSRCEDSFTVVKGATHPIALDPNTGETLCDFCAAREETFAESVKGLRINVCHECEAAEAIDSDHGMCDECLQLSRV